MEINRQPEARAILLEMRSIATILQVTGRTDEPMERETLAADGDRLKALVRDLARLTVSEL